VIVESLAIPRPVRNAQQAYAKRQIREMVQKRKSRDAD
jgi:hypothetical protein